ncbi:MAG: peptide chain release factor 1 [Candidatus Dadabacteria bacterium]|nr:MAG: peptide chain release factor 1 [Candidatus Dadabacteria bacterium]
MWEKLKEVEERFEELADLLSQPEVATNPQLLQKYSKERKDLEEIVAVYRAYKKAKSELKESKELLNSSEDPEIAELAQEEIKLLKMEMEKLEERLQILLIPKDPNDEKNVVLEIRAGAGGDEAAIFVGDLFTMYTRYAELRGWKVEIMNAHHSSQGGYKEIIAMVNGEGAYSRLKYEKGVHRVQRVPVTETQGRIHTSTVTVAVLPEAEDIEIEINDKDLKIDVFRASGPGGQSVNTTDSAVRITHIPTGIVVSMQDEKSQIKNKAKALKVLKARLLEKKEAEALAERSADRRSQVGTGDRSERIRTYNFPQSRVTDHRIGLTVHNLDEILQGELDPIINALAAHYQAEALKRGEGRSN